MQLQTINHLIVEKRQHHCDQHDYKHPDFHLPAESYKFQPRRDLISEEKRCNSDPDVDYYDQEQDDVAPYWLLPWLGLV